MFCFSSLGKLDAVPRSISLVFIGSPFTSFAESTSKSGNEAEVLNDFSFSSEGVASNENEQKKSSFSRLSEGLVSVCQEIIP